MTIETHDYLGLAPILALAIVPAVIVAFWIRALLRISLGVAGLYTLVITICTAVIAIWLSDDQNAPQWSSFAQRMRSVNGPIVTVCIIVVANMGIALVVKLYRAAVLEQATPEEMMLGVRGVRAWLTPLNIITVIFVAVSAYCSLGYDFIGVAIAGLCLLLSYPLVNTMLHQSAAFPTTEDHTAPLKAPADERERVLALVEAGKITAEDGAELLTALAQSQAAGIGAASTISGPRRIMLVGAAIALVGFLLPWFTVNVTQAMHDAMSSVQQNMTQFPGSLWPNVTFTPPNTDGAATQVPVQNALQISVRGGDVQHGSGWMILAGALVAAGLPFFWTPRATNPHVIRNATLAALSGGSVVLLYVLSVSFNAITSVEAGFVMAIIGYVVLWVGSIQEYFALPAALRPSFVTA